MAYPKPGSISGRIHNEIRITVSRTMCHRDYVRIFRRNRKEKAVNST